MHTPKYQPEQKPPEEEEEQSVKLALRVRSIGGLIFFLVQPYDGGLPTLSSPPGFRFLLTVQLVYYLS